MTNRRLSCRQPFEIGCNVYRSHLVPIHEQLATLVLANAQATNLLLFHFNASIFSSLLHHPLERRMGSTFMKTNSACFACVMLRSGHNQESFRYLAKKTHANTGWQSLESLTCREPPTPICQEEGSVVRPQGVEFFVKFHFRLLHLYFSHPPSSSMIDLPIELKR